MSTRRVGRNAASLAVLSALLLGYYAVDQLYLDNDDGVSNPKAGRSLQSLQMSEALQEVDRADAEALLEAMVEEDIQRQAEARVLAMAGSSPPSADEVPGEYIVKPYVGYAQNNVYETSTARLKLHSAQSSTVNGSPYIPRLVMEPEPQYWMSSATKPATDELGEWLQIDTGAPQTGLQTLDITWHETYWASAYTIQIAPQREDCRKNGEACPDYWITVADVTGKTDGSATSHNLESGDLPIPEGVRYARIMMKAHAPGQNAYGVYEVQVYRKPMILGDTPTTTYCGDTTAAVTSSLLATHGGSLITTFEAAEFFHASMSKAQKESMFADPCTFTVEPNYVIRARGRTSPNKKRRLGRGASNSHVDELKSQIKTQEEVQQGQGEAQQRRRLAIPEFNLRDENPPNWGLERIGSFGKRNGKYMWFHEGEDTHLYIFDTGVYPEHSEWTTSGQNQVTQGQKDAEDILEWELETRTGTSRLGFGTTCIGGESDWTQNDHGTFVASIAAGFTFGTGKSTTIHPLQVLDTNGEGTTATFLCGVERVIQDTKDYYAVYNVDDNEKFQGVVNLSLGVEGRSDILDRAVQDLSDAGVLVVIAAGDNNENACFYSPYHEKAVTVGALNRNGAIWFWRALKSHSLFWRALTKRTKQQAPTADDHEHDATTRNHGRDGYKRIDLMTPPTRLHTIGIG